MNMTRGAENLGVWGGGGWAGSAWHWQPQAFFVMWAH